MYFRNIKMERLSKYKFSVEIILLIYGRKQKILFQEVDCQKNDTGTPTQGYAYCSYQEKQHTAKSKERIDKLAAAQTAVNPFFNAIYCFSSMSKHAPHSSASLYPSSNIKLREAHIFCFLFIEKNDFNAKFYQLQKTFEIWISFQGISVAPTSQVKFFFRESRNQIAQKNLLIDRR